MNPTTQEQIKERARETVKIVLDYMEVVPYNRYPLEQLTNIIESSLTTQQTAADSANREEVEREIAQLTGKRYASVEELIQAESSESFKALWAAIREQDALRAEAAQLREALRRVTEALKSSIAKGEENMAQLQSERAECIKSGDEEGRKSSSSEYYAYREGVEDLRAALAAPLLKEGA